MLARRGRLRQASLCLAAILAAAVVGGCATTVDGTASVADGVPGGDEPTDEPTDDPTDEPTDDPTDEPTDDPTDEPTDEPTDDPPTRGPGGSADSICDLFTPEELQGLFGEPVTTAPDSDGRGCDFDSSSHYVHSNVYDYLPLTDDYESNPNGERITIAGHPAIVTDIAVIVGRSSDPAAPGQIVAYSYSDQGDAHGEDLAIAILERAAPAFAK